MSINNKILCTYQAISDYFNLNSRQDSNNYFRQFQDSGQDFGAYFTRKRELGAALPFVQEQILDNCKLPISEHYDIFRNKHPEFVMSITTFGNMVTETDALKLYNLNRKHLKERNKKTQETLPEADVSDISRKCIDSNFMSVPDDNNWKMYNLSRNLPFTIKHSCLYIF
jgi:hypothetical protein